MALHSCTGNLSRESWGWGQMYMGKEVDLKTLKGQPNHSLWSCPCVCLPPHWAWEIRRKRERDRRKRKNRAQARPRHAWTWSCFSAKGIFLVK
jgi:hypothetical protein